MTSFTVDTHVFRELGELLVGRDSTALIELIKNSYDADATDVVVYGNQLGDADRGTIVVVDDGLGMNAQTFSEGFLRIASRGKDVGSRRSTKFKRRYTGAKGIGRLAAHKLARILEVESLSRASNAVKGLMARIDWDKIEQKETLDQVHATDAISVNELQPGVGAKPGTRITLRRLRRKWSKTEHSRFLEEIQSFGPPDPLTNPLPSNVVQRQLLFGKPQIRDAQTEARFSVRLEGDLAPPEDYWIAAVEAAHWILEIDALTKPGTVHYCIAPSQRATEELGKLETRRYRLQHPGGEEGPKFQARILLRTGIARGNEQTRAWSGRSSGVRVYMEGFRVLPYGESNNDWLGLDRDYAERKSDPLSEAISQALMPTIDSPSDDRPGLLHLPNKHYFGAVFLTQRNAPSLRMLVNREGFIPDGQYDQVVQLVRAGIDLTTRVRAVATAGARQDRREQRAKPAIPATSAGTDQPSFVAVLADAERHASAARRFTSAGDTRAAARQLDVALERIKHVALASDELADQAAMLRVLASVGTQLSSFIHELNGLLGMAESIEAALKRLIEQSELKRETRSRLNDISVSVGDLRRHLERQASYLLDVVSVDARRRRARQKLQGRFEAATRLVQTAADLRGIDIANEIPAELKSPPMFAAELTTVFANILTNAIKAAGKNGRVRASGRDGSKQTVIRVENSGKAVNLKTSEKWFRPFESSTTEVDPILGQGMGLGLTITRSMLDEYGAKIHFVKPSQGYSTAVEIIFNG